MRAHHQRRLLWIVNAVLGLGLLGLVAWYVLDVRTRVADAAYLNPAFAEQALRAYEEEPPAAQSALKAPVAEAELDEIDLKRFQKNGKRWWWLYSGPVPPKPPEDAPVETIQKPTESALDKLGAVLFLIYWPPESPEEVAEESVLSWKFGEGRVEEFKPGEPIREKKNDPWSLRLHDIKRAPGGGYEIVYEVFDQSSTDPMEPKGKSLGLQSLFWGAKPPIDDLKDLRGRIRVELKNPTEGDAAAASAASAAPGDAAARAGVTNAPTPAETPPESTPASEPEPSIVRWEDARRSRATVEFDRDAYDSFRGKSAEDIAKGIKTQEARDASGRVVGVQITGLDAGNPAMKFDVQRGDILKSIDGKPIGSRSDILNIIQSMDPNVSRVTVVLERRGRDITYVIDPRDPETRRAARMLENNR